MNPLKLVNKILQMQLMWHSELILQMQSNTYYPTKEATQYFIIQDKFQEHIEGEYFTTSFLLCLCPLLKLAHYH
jgi:hypothetical protein